MSISLAGKTAIVTSASEDAGQAISQRFLDAGAKVVLAESGDRKEKAQLDGEARNWVHFPFVMQDRLCIQNLIATTTDRFGDIDILVNAAQPVTEPGMFLDLTTENFDSAFGDTVRSTFQLSQAIAAKMIDRGENEVPGGAIINITSIASRRTVPELLAYSVSCAALDQLTRSMAASLAPRGIRVNAVALGGVLTERLRSAFREDDTLRDDMLAVTPMGRLADTEEAAETALFLASEHASYITGQIVSVDGGRTLLDPLASPIR